MITQCVSGAQLRQVSSVCGCFFVLCPVAEICCLVRLMQPCVLAFVFLRMALMELRKQLLSLGFVGDDRRLDKLLSFLQRQEVEQLEDLIGCPSLGGFAGANEIHDHELLFLHKVCVLRVLMFVLS